MTNLESLTIIFRLNSSGSEKITLGRNKAEVLKKSSGISDKDALSAILSVLSKNGQSPIFFQAGKKIDAQSYLIGNNQWKRSISACGMSFRFADVGNFEHSFILIEELDPGAAGGWQQWVDPFVSMDGFVQAWISDVGYDHWQNAKDLLQYSSAGRDHSSLPKKTNGLPAPLEQIEIDISRNPCRRVLRPGFVEAIGSTMWLGEPFWELVGKNRKDEVLTSKIITADDVGNNVSKISVAEQCFSDVSTAAIQQNFRSLLYNT
jgi:hypothetical protein